MCRQGLVGRPEGKRPIERPRRRMKDNIKMDLHSGNKITEEERRGVEWKIILKWIFIRVMISQKKKDETGDTYGGHERCRQHLVWKSEGKRPIERTRRSTPGHCSKTHSHTTGYAATTPRLQKRIEL